MENFRGIKETSTSLWWNNVASNIVIDNNDPNYIKYDLTNSNAEALLVMYYDRAEYRYFEFYVELLGLKEFYIPKLVPSEGAYVIPVSSLEHPKPSDDSVEGLVVDNEIITGEVFENYTSHFDGETKQAYKLNAIKDGEFLQSVLLEYDGFWYYDPVSEEHSHEVRLVSVKPRYGPVFRKNVKSGNLCCRDASNALVAVVSK